MADLAYAAMAGLGLAFLAGMLGGAMNALAGGGSFATLPALILLGLPANIANATSNVALLPGAAASAWSFRDELGPIGGVSARVLAAITFVAGLAGSLLLVVKPLFCACAAFASRLPPMAASASMRCIALLR